MLRKRAFIALMVLIITMMFCLVSWSEPNPKQTKSEGKTSKLSAQKTTDQIKPADNIVTNQQLIDAIFRAIDATAQKAKTTQDPPPPNNSTFWFSLFLVIFTGVLATVAIFQFFVLKNTLKETQIVANAAKDSAEVAENTLQISERAYLAVDADKYVINKFGAGERIRIDYEIKNIGHTYAQITESSQAISIININDIPLEPDYSICETHPFNHLLRANGGIAHRVAIKMLPITLDDFQDIMHGTCCVAIWGKIIYKDIFKISHVVGFGAMYNYQFHNFIMMDGYNYVIDCEPDKQQN